MKEGGGKGKKKQGRRSWGPEQGDHLTEVALRGIDDEGGGASHEGDELRKWEKCRHRGLSEKDDESKGRRREIVKLFKRGIYLKNKEGKEDQEKNPADKKTRGK